MAYVSNDMTTEQCEIFVQVFNSIVQSAAKVVNKAEGIFQIQVDSLTPDELSCCREIESVVRRHM